MMWSSGRGEGVEGGCKMIDRQSTGGKSVSRVMQIEEIGLDDQGYLFVRPWAASADEFAYIYRAAMGIRWNSRLRVLHAYEPARWAATDLYKQIIAAVCGEYGIQLQLTHTTVWSGLPEDVRKSIEAFDLDTAAE
jgi:Integron Cassette Protein Hfx_Cass5